MKKVTHLSICFVFSLLLIHCQTNTKHYVLTAKDSLRIDSEAFAELHPNAQRDSAEEPKAIANILFGISPSEYKKQEKIFLKSCQDSRYEWTVYKIGDYEFFRVYPSFYNNKLYRVTLTGKFISYDDYDTRTNEQAIAITKVFKDKFGEPTVDNGLIPWYRTEKGKWYRIVAWMIGKKQIDVLMDNQGTDNTVDLNIFRTDIKALMDTAESRQKDSVAHAAKNKI